MMGEIRKILVMLTAAATLAGCAEHGELDVGDSMPSLQWEGYVNEEAEGLSTMRPFADYGIAQLEESGRRYALLHTAEAF